MRFDDETDRRRSEAGRNGKAGKRTETVTEEDEKKNERKMDNSGRGGAA